MAGGNQSAADRNGTGFLASDHGQLPRDGTPADFTPVSPDDNFRIGRRDRSLGVQIRIAIGCGSLHFNPEPIKTGLHNAAGREPSVEALTVAAGVKIDTENAALRSDVQIESPPRDLGRQQDNVTARIGADDRVRLVKVQAFRPPRPVHGDAQTMPAPVF